MTEQDSDLIEISEDDIENIRKLDFVDDEDIPDLIQDIKKAREGIEDLIDESAGDREQVEMVYNNPALLAQLVHEITTLEPKADEERIINQIKLELKDLDRNYIELLSDIRTERIGWTDAIFATSISNFKEDLKELDQRLKYTQQVVVESPNTIEIKRIEKVDSEMIEKTDQGLIFSEYNSNIDELENLLDSVLSSRELAVSELSRIEHDLDFRRNTMLTATIATLTFVNLVLFSLSEFNLVQSLLHWIPT